MAGYALLPTLEMPTSHLTFRLSHDEKKERDEWILGAVDHGWSIADIASDVGLSIQRVKQIIKPSKSQQPKSKKSFTHGKFDSPRDAAVANFVANSYHMMSSGGCKKFDPECNSCFGSLMIIESEYDADGWPYSWAMDGQEEFIAASKPRSSDK